MGACFEFTCGGCGHAVDVSGGRDYGKITVTRTIRCKDCMELFDVAELKKYLTEDELPKGAH